MKNLKITGLELKAEDGLTVRLSLEEARALHGELEVLFGREKEYVPFNPVIQPWRERPLVTWTTGDGV